MALQKKFILTDGEHLSTALNYTQSIIFDETRKSIWAPSKTGEMTQYSSYTYATELGAEIDQLKTTVSGTSYQFAVTGNPSTAYITHTGETSSGVTTYTLDVTGVVNAVGGVDSYAHAVGGALVTLSEAVVETISIDSGSASYLTATRGTNSYTLAVTNSVKNAVAQVETWAGNSDDSIDHKISYAVSTIVAGADTSYDTLKEIADWILNDTTGAAALANAVATLKGDESTTGSVAYTVKNAVDALDGTATGSANGVAITVSETDGKLNSNATVTVTGATVTYTAPSGNDPASLAVTDNSSYVLVGSAIAEIVKYVDAKATAASTIAAVTMDDTSYGTYAYVTTENGSVTGFGVTVTPGTFGTSTASGVVKSTDGLAYVADVATAVNAYVNLAIGSLDASGSYNGSYISYSYTEVDGKITEFNVSVDDLVNEINAKELVTAAALNTINSEIGADYDITYGTIKHRLDEIESAIEAVDMSFTYVTAGTDNAYIGVAVDNDTSDNDMTYTITAKIGAFDASASGLSTTTDGLASVANVTEAVNTYVAAALAGQDSSYSSSVSDGKFITAQTYISIADGKLTTDSYSYNTVQYGDLSVDTTGTAASPFATATDGIAYVSDIAEALNDYFSWGTV